MAEVLTGPVGTVAERSALHAYAARLGVGCACCSVVVRATGLLLAPGWDGCATARADVLVARSLGIPVHELTAPPA